ncbi:MAG: NAD-dependent epimerase/dehydratase family protein [Alteromonadaceae bacterium]|nr:NAD-dependent epimerase/dehydratase family protein [Alteromonadaceae bacterium]
MQQGLIAITGATGFIGHYLQQELARAGFPVVGITRNGGNGCRSVGDLSAAPRWEACLEGVETVIHCAAVAHRPVGCTPEELDYLDRVNVQATESLASACRHAGVRRLIFLSSVKVYGESTAGRSPFTETDPLAPEDAYGESKRQAEAILEAHAGERLQVCSLRLPLVYGPNAKANVRKLERLSLSGLPLPFGSIRNRRSLLSLDNLGCVVKALLSRAEWPCRLNVADPGPVSVAELVRYLAAAHGRRVRLFPVPVALFTLAGRLAGRQSMVQRLTGDLEMDTTCLNEALAPLRLGTTQACLSSSPKKTGSREPVAKNPNLEN